MTPADIVKVLAAAAPIAASVASMANKSEVVERKEPSVTNNVSITVVNNFYTNSEKEAMCLASEMQSNMFRNFSETRYML
jgi:hypothetical protein